MLRSMEEETITTIAEVYGNMLECAFNHGFKDGLQFAAGESPLSHEEIRHKYWLASHVLQVKVDMPKNMVAPVFDNTTRAAINVYEQGNYLPAPPKAKL